MKLSHYIKRVESSDEFKKFKKQNPSAYLCAGFFVIDYETGQAIQQIDYALSNNKVATFILDDGIKSKISKQTLKKKIPKISSRAKTDLDSLKGIVEDEMKNRTVTESLRKIIAVMHILDGKPIWNLQCILGGMGLLNVHVDDSDQSVLKFEKHSLMELIKQMPNQNLLLPKKQKPEKHEKNKIKQIKLLLEKEKQRAEQEEKSEKLKKQKPKEQKKIKKK